MRIGQILWEGRPTAAIFDKGATRALAGQTVLSLLHKADELGSTLAAVAAEETGTPADGATPIVPVHPPEVWACGCTYETSAAFRDAEHGTREGFYAYVYKSENRPEVFFKGTARICVGPDEPIGLRADAKFTAPEPELAVLLNGKGQIAAFTLANDVSAWDIERENPLYLPQSKTFSACCALGPYWITADELSDPYGLQMRCTIQRGQQTLFSGETSTSKLNRKLEVLIEYLRRSNDVPSGTVLMTGTGIIVTEEAALQAGDVVAIAVQEFGELRNTAVVV